MKEYLIAKANYLKGLSDEIACDEIDELIELYIDDEISAKEFSKEMQSSFLTSVSTDFRKKYEKGQLKGK